MLTKSRLALMTILLAGAPPLHAQSAQPPPAMTCGPSSAGSSAGCEAHHFHVALYRFETRGWAEAWGVNRFATAAGCEAARIAEVRNAQALASFMRAEQPKNPIELLRVGDCHCDLSSEKTHARYLDDLKRTRQLREMMQIRDEIRERLLDMGATPGSDVLRALVQAPSRFPSGVWSRQIPPIDPPRGFVVDPASMTLKDTAVGKESTSRQQETAFELAQIGALGAAPPAQHGTPAAPQPQPPVTETKVEAEPQVAEPASSEQVVEATAQSERLDEESAADRFISYETSRISNILKASESISDDEVRRKIFESSLERSQVLENLRKIIDGAGAKSRLAELAQKALSEPDTFELVSRLFGALVAKHWAPADARDAVIVFPSAITDDPIAVLRDTTGRYSTADRQAALYVALAREALTSNQESWLTGVVESLVAK